MYMFMFHYCRAFVLYAERFLKQRLTKGTKDLFSRALSRSVVTYCHAVRPMHEPTNRHVG